MKFLYAILNIQTVFDLEDVELNIIHTPLEAVAETRPTKIWNQVTSSDCQITVAGTV